MIRGSLQRRLFAVILVSAIPVFFIHLTVQILGEIRTDRARATLITNDIAAAAIPLLQSTLVVGDLSTAQETLDNIMRHGQFQSLRLLAPGGTQILAEGKPRLRINRGNAPDWFVKLLGFHFDRQRFPIMVGGVDYGALLAEPSPNFLVADIWRRLWIAAGLWLAALALLLALVKVTLRQGLRPLEELAAAAQRLGAGDLECRAPVHGAPELAATAREFNRMAENLAEAQDRLEERVRQRTAELTTSEARTLAILRNLQDGVVQIDMDGNILLVNQAVCTLFGHGEADMLGRNIGLLIPELRRLPHAACQASPDSGTRTSNPDQSCEVTGRRTDGSEFNLELTANELADTQGSTYIIVLRDISQRKAAEVAREAARAHAEELAQAKSDFLANMSHEIRTPLNAMLGLAQVGLRKVGETDAHQTFARILRSGELLLRLINDILDFSKIEAQKLRLEAVPFELCDVIDRAVDLNAPQCYAKGLDFSVEEMANLPSRCLGDPIRISQVLVNLLSNAIKFSESGHVGLRVAREGRSLAFRVSDTGIGIPAEVIGRLFQPFEQADGSITRRFGGTGLGLVISQRLVTLMGGEIHVESHPGEGTCIEARIPFIKLEGPSQQHLPCRFHLLGLPDGEAGRLPDSLPGHPVSRADSATPLARLDAGLIVADAAFLTGHLYLARALIQHGLPIAIVHTPGVRNALPDDITAACRHLDRPLRARHLIQAHMVPMPDRGSLLPPGPARRLAGLRILAAEDDAANGLVLREILLLEGAALTLVENGVAACDRLLEDGPDAYDIVLTDLQMPLLDGYATARRIREIAPRLPIIGLSAHVLREERERGLAAGMEDMIAKPFAIDMLVAALLQHLPQDRKMPPAMPDELQENAPAREALSDPAAAESSPPPVDWPALEARFNGKPAFISQLAETVRDSYASTPALLKAAIAADDRREMAALGHKIRGMSANLMAQRLCEWAEKTEDAARAGLPEAREYSQRMADELDRVLESVAARVP